MDARGCIESVFVVTLVVDAGVTVFGSDLNRGGVKVVTKSSE